MPNLNGADTFRELKALDPSVKVIMASGFGFEISAKELLEDGVVGFLRKPYRLSELSRRIDRVLDVG